MPRTPIWRAIADTLQTAIAEGQYATGTKLPTEAALSIRFGVNRHTVRHAISHLVDQGLVHTRRGAGVFVLAKPLDYPLSTRMRFHQNLLAAGRMPDKSMLSIEVVAASEDDARRLSVDVGAAIAVTQSLSYSDGTPVALAERRFPEVRLPGLAKALADEPSVTKALAGVGVSDYQRSSTRLTATVASAAQALHLRVQEGAPLLLTQSLNKDVQGLPVEHGQSWFASERITLTLDHADQFL